ADRTTPTRAAHLSGPIVSASGINDAATSTPADLLMPLEIGNVLALRIRHDRFRVGKHFGTNLMDRPETERLFRERLYAAARGRPGREREKRFRGLALPPADSPGFRAGGAGAECSRIAPSAPERHPFGVVRTAPGRPSTASRRRSGKVPPPSGPVPGGVL